MNCRAFRSQLEELSPDRLPGDDAQSHAAACPACGDFYREQLTLNQLIQSIEPVCAPPDFDDKLNGRLDAAQHARPTRRFLYLDFIPGTASIAFASVFALAVCAAVLLKETHSGGNLTPRATQQTQAVALKNFPEATQPTLRNDVPVARRIVYTGLAIASPKITATPSLKKPGDSNSKANFADLRREAGTPEKNSKPIEVTAPQMKSVIFSSGVAPIVTRPTAKSLPDTQDSPNVLIKSAQAKDQFADTLRASGVETKAITAQLANGYGAQGGLLVVSVQPQSAAFRGGLRSGDVIEAVNNQLLSGARQPQNLKDTNSLSLAVVRDNQRFSVTLPTAQSTHQ